MKAAPPDQRSPSPQTFTKEQLFAHLQTSEQGLTSQEAEQRLDDYGPNEPARVQHGATIFQLLRLFLNPLAIILLFASFVSASLGESVNAIIIATMVLLGVGLNFVQTYNSQRAVERLRAGVAPTATVPRDGTWQELPRHLVVPGDMVRLSAGDLVPADARLLEAADLHVQQAALTGESLPVEKIASDQPVAGGQLADALNCVFLGTSVVSGTAKRSMENSSRMMLTRVLATRRCTAVLAQKASAFWP